MSQQPLITSDLELLQGAYSGSLVYGDEMLVFHPSGGWATQPGVHGYIATLTDPYSSEMSVLSVSSDDGTVYRIDYGGSRDGAFIEQVMLTPWIDFGAPAHRKWLRRIVLETTTDATDITVEVGVDYSDRFQHSFTPESAGTRLVWYKKTDPRCGRWYKKTDPRCYRWYSDGARWVADMPATIHCNAFRLRITGRSLKLIGIGIGWLPKGA